MRLIAKKDLKLEAEASPFSQVSALPKGAMVEIEAVAVLGKMVDYDIQ